MQLTRRSFGKTVVLAGAASGLASFTLLPTTGCSTSWIAVAEKDLPVIVDIATTIASIVAEAQGAGAITPLVAAAISEAAKVFSAGLTTLQDAVTAYQASKSAGDLAAVIAALNAVQQDAPNVIAAVTQAPASIVSIVTSAIGTAVTLLAAIQSLLPSSTTAAGNKATVAASQRVPVKTAIKLPDTKTLIGGFNSVLSVYGYGDKQIG